MSQPKLNLRPPPHRDFIQGFPGIVASNARPPAHVAGTVEVRLGTKGLRAAWLRIELRKLETLPGGESWGELIGRGPIDVWSAGKDDTYKSDSEKGWELLQTADFPFQVTIPEGLPPSAKLEKNAGIGYELVTSLCVRSKKGLLKKETTSSIIQNTHPLWLDKHELHSTWPIYSAPDDHEALQDDIRVKVMRERSCYGPGDNVGVRIILISDRVAPIKVKSISFSIRETITFKGGAKKTFSSNKAASQKTETLSSKSKSFGKKVYKGDTHTFDLACQIPRTHSLMTIQTAKHIEVSYTLRVQVETAKKPIIIDHLPLTVSNFARAASEGLMPRIGWVPGLSAPAEGTDYYPDEVATMPPSASNEQQPAIARSISFGGSTYSGSRGSYPGYAGGDLRRRDTVMTQGTAISGPGMAGRGVPGQVFSWGQYGSAQPFGSGEAPRPAFAGPPSIYEGRELAPEETRALFHSTNRPQSAMVLGTAIDPVLMPPSSYHGHSGTVTPIAESSEDGDAHPNFPQRSPYQQQMQFSSQPDVRRHSYLDAAASAGSLVHPQGARYGSGTTSPADPRYTASPVDGRSPHNEQSAFRGTGPADLGTTRYVRPEPVHQAVPTQLQPAVPPSRMQGADSNGAVTSAEAEKQRLYERARQQAERNQRRADERRALHQGTAPEMNGGRPYSMFNLASSSEPPSDAPVPGAAGAPALSAEAEKMRLFERARAEAERYQGSYQGGVAFPADGSAGSSNTPGASGSQPLQTSVNSAVVSGRAAPYPSYMTAEEEKRQLYERAKAEADAYQRGEGSTATVTGPSSSSQPLSGHQHAASVSSGAAVDVPGSWPRSPQDGNQASSGSATAGGGGGVGSSSSGPSIVPAGPAVSEKEQLRRYYEARDAVSQHLQQPSSSNSTAQAPHANGASIDRTRTPEVASATHPVTPHQPANTAATSTRIATPTINTGVQSYLTEAEQQSAEEKERLASHYARKQAKAEAKANGKLNGGQTVGGSEKAQLAAYYAARDAMEQNARGGETQTGSSRVSSGAAATSSIPPAAASPVVNRNSNFVHPTTDHPRAGGGNTFRSSADQWAPRYNSLYDDDDDDEKAAIGRGAAPPPLPPKIPLGTSQVSNPRWS
ncbi:Arrestin_C domain-containing protein [Pseudozyma hubeiensis]|nr:Arrestin_C domain-containing protein [Pseudozyma hubeiensis]